MTDVARSKSDAKRPISDVMLRLGVYSLPVARARVEEMEGFAASRRSKRRGDQPRRDQHMVALVDLHTRALIENAARDRGVSPFGLLGRIAEIVAHEDLFNAVLDDGR